MTVEHLDVLIVGAGLSGVGAACHVRRQCPDKRIAILEGRSALGGTWDLFRYPGIRSDSDMYTLGYNFKPWTDPQIIADGPSIRRYIEETAREHGIDSLIRYRHRVLEANWCSTSATWQVLVQCGDDPEPLRLRCHALAITVTRPAIRRIFTGSSSFVVSWFIHSCGRKTWTTAASASW